jgi:hypothetical protein
MKLFSYFNPNLDNCESEYTKCHNNIVCLIIDPTVVQLYHIIISMHKIRCDLGAGNFKVIML